MADLVTLKEYKDYRGISSPNDDAKLKLLITSISQLVKTYCGTTFVDYATTAKEEYFNISFDTEFVQLTESPIIDIVSVEERASITEDYETLTEFEYFFDEKTDSIWRMSSNGISYDYFPKGAGSVRVTYTSGYSECPEDLKLAVFDLITYYAKEEYKQVRAIAGTTMQNQGTSSQNNSADFPDHIKRVLDLYRLYHG